VEEAVNFYNYIALLFAFAAACFAGAAVIGTKEGNRIQEQETLCSSRDGKLVTGVGGALICVKKEVIL
jgi:hypothetical protein